eukprot:TRINITY_DN10595_c0_g1_i5.p1 TRINITY_DN10595_c0_g1~~TRINITY_DN10595_c0_g1_i5.p1  ORF type:complete len:108 (-),score=20.23 TRINITY_DN10595_c0_g1_i5:386-709(-)
MFFFFQAEDGIRDLVRSRGLGDVYKRQIESHVDQCLSSLGGEPTTHQSPPSRAFGGATTNPGQWAEMNRCELNQILQQGLSSRELQSLEHSLQGFLNQVRKATSREQ